MMYPTNKEYTAPSVEVLDVVCEAGFQNTTTVSYLNGTDDGFENL